MRIKGRAANGGRRSAVGGRRPINYVRRPSSIARRPSSVVRRPSPIAHMTDSYDYDLVCIGSGPAGQRGAVQAAKLGRRVAVVERRTTLGGICVATGTIPSKTFREAVLSLTAPGANSSLGRTTARPTAQQLLARADEVVSREGSVIANQLTRNGVDVFCGDASFVDPHRLRVAAVEGWREITAANVLIASGTRALPPSGVKTDGESVITSDEIGSLKQLPRSLAVVGAGVI